MNPSSSAAAPKSAFRHHAEARPDPVQRPYWLRLCRAVALLAVALSAHMWLGSVAQLEDSPLPALPASLWAPQGQPSMLRLSSGKVIVQHVTLSAADMLPLRWERPAGAPEPDEHQRFVQGTPQPLLKPVAVVTTGPVFAPAAMSDVALPAVGWPSSTLSTPPGSAQNLSARAHAVDSVPNLPDALNLDVHELALPAAKPEERQPARASVPAAAHDASTELNQQTQVILGVLDQYTRAVERLDTRAVKAVWPTLDRRNERELQRSFHQLEEQQVRFASCGVQISGEAANARCRGDVTYRPKVGSRVLRLTEREWQFNLSRAEDGWQIVKVGTH
jgi:hypothetical protein